MNTAIRPVVDVILPAYNGARVIREALDSAVAQDRVSCRIIVVDDGSTDDTVRVVRSYGPRIALQSQANKGVSGARNTGLGLGEAPYVALLDQDDVWLPGKLTRQVDLLEAHGEAGLVFTDMTLFQVDGQVLEVGFLRATPAYAALERRAIGRDAHLLSMRAAEAVTRYNFISPSTVLLRRRAIEGVGGFDERLRLCDDAECWMRLLRTWRAIVIEERLVRSRVWAGNASLRTGRMLWERILIADKVMAHPELYATGTTDYLMRERAACQYRLGTIALRDGEVQMARRHFLASFRDSPRAATILLLAASFLGPRGRRLLAWARRAAGVRMAARVG